MTINIIRSMRILFSSVMSVSPHVVSYNTPHPNVFINEPANSRTFYICTGCVKKANRTLDCSWVLDTQDTKISPCHCFLYFSVAVEKIIIRSLWRLISAS